MTLELIGDGDIEITRAQNRNFALAAGFHRMASPSNSWSLCLCYQAQAERLYRRAVEEFERLRALQPELPNEPISDSQAEEHTPVVPPKTNPFPSAVSHAGGFQLVVLMVIAYNALHMNRRHFLGAMGSAAFAQQPQRFDLLIRNGTVCDPARNMKRRADVGISGDKIAAIEDRLPADRGIEVVDANGLYVTPGLVDLHTHCYHGATGLGIEADPIAARSGVTTWVDAGSFGVTQAPGFRRFIVEPARVRIFGFVYLYPDTRNPDIDPVKYVRGFIRRNGETITANRDILLGIKLQIGSNMNGRYSYDFLKIARELCDTYRIPLLAHISFAPPTTDQVMELMKPGDIITHCYNQHTLGIIDESGKVRESVREARRRGVLFDVGHGNGSFNFEAARKAIADGFVCDTISTDIYGLNIKGPVFDMPTTMSKMMYLGMSFDDVLMRTTIAPAKIVNRVEGLGTLAVGAPADVALLKIEDGEFPLTDSQKNTVMAKQRIVSPLAICRGKRVA